MKNRLKKRRLYTNSRHRPISLSAEERAWLDIAPVGREFGSPTYEQWGRIDAKLATARLGEIHPGEILLKEFIEPHGMTVAQFAGQIGWPLDRVSGIIHGAAPVTDEIALSIGLFFNMPARFWLDLQAEYDRRQSRQNADDSRAAEE